MRIAQQLMSIYNTTLHKKEQKYYISLNVAKRLVVWDTNMPQGRQKMSVHVEFLKYSKYVYLFRNCMDENVNSLFASCYLKIIFTEKKKKKEIHTSHDKNRQSASPSYCQQLVTRAKYDAAIYSSIFLSAQIYARIAHFTQTGSDWPQMGQIRDFFRSYFSTFWLTESFPEKVPYLFNLDPIWPIWGPI